jgi:maltose alpha-D-glucosyltransferase/alpha-amylase
MPNWLNDAVFYEIYPQSFCDSNGDGIGDLQGIVSKLDYVRALGCNALWINPCFDSPFKDAGYDVRDYCRVAPRYGTNEDLYRLFAQAHEKGIRVLLDLVPGHTSEEHPWFLESAKAEPNEYSGRYIWTDFWIRGIPNHPYIGGETPRNGTYMLNFFKCQPALNYGWREPTEPWQCGVNDPDALATREALKNVMRFWLERGCDGFRVDMADSLVKEDDEQKSCTAAIWREIRQMLDRDYPEAVLVSEWSNPKLSLNAGFHADFYLDHWGNGYHSLLRQTDDGTDRSYFKKDADSDIFRFLDDYLPKYEATKDVGAISFFTCNHDTPRLAPRLSERELELAYAVLFTLPGVPFLYYGDEIGMRYLADLPSKEGGYTRTGSRTPMQWDRGPNMGFSAGPAARLYLPVDPSPDAPCVSEAQGREGLYETVRGILALRHKDPDLKAEGPFAVLYAKHGDPLFIYRRGGRVAAVNPSGKPRSAAIFDLPENALPLFRIGGAAIEGGRLTLEPQSFVLF